MMFLTMPQKGKPFDFGARRHTAIAEAANDYLSRKHRLGAASAIASRPGLISISNATGADFARGDAVTIGAPVTLPATDLDLFWNRMLFAATKPATGDDGLMAVCVEPIKDGFSGYAVAAGAVPCQLEIPSSGAWIEFADIKDASHALLLRPEGTARVLWRAGGTSGTEWAFVQLGVDSGNRYLKAVADAEISADGSGTVSVWRNGADTGFNLTAHLNWMHGGEVVSASKELVIKWFADEAKWIIVHAECEA